MSTRRDGYTDKQLEGYSPEQREEFRRWYRQVSKKIEVSDVAGPVRLAPPRIESMPRFPHNVWPAPADMLERNLEKYIELALNMGAADARAILAREGHRGR